MNIYMNVNGKCTKTETFYPRLIEKNSTHYMYILTMYLTKVHVVLILNTQNHHRAHMSERQLNRWQIDVIPR